MNLKKKSLFLWSVTVFGLLNVASCSKKSADSNAIDVDFETENVIVVLVDGPRYSETWGDKNKTHIPNQFQTLSALGAVNENFHNWGVTRTVSGHTAALTGVYEDIENTGKQYPSNPSFLQFWLEKTRNSPNKAWIVSSKEKLGVLGNCTNLKWRNSFEPSIDALDRPDLYTYLRVLEVMDTHQPNLIFVNLSGPDKYGHGGNWNGYLSAIEETDSMVNELVRRIEIHPHYKGKTTLIMSNDHGRHIDGIRDGFVNHGDHCIGCTHINFFAFGPDFKSNVIVQKERELTDIAPTVMRLMGLNMTGVEGSLMEELFK